MAKFRFEGLDGYVIKLKRLADPEDYEGMIKASIYPGAGTVADEIRKNLSAHHDTGDLLDSLYLGTMRNENGYIFTQVGFAGYDRDGVANALKANALESGTSRGQPKTPFIRPALKNSQAKAEALMAAELDARIKKLMED